MAAEKPTPTNPLESDFDSQLSITGSTSTSATPPRPAPVLIRSGSGMPPSSTPPPQRRWWRRRWFVIGLIVVAALILLAVLYVYPAWAASRRLKNRWAAARSANYSGSLRITGSSFLSAIEGQFKLAGSYQKTPHFAVATNFDGQLSGGQYDGSALVDDDNLYLKLKASYEPVLRYRQSVFTYQLTPDWTRTALGVNLFYNLCDVKAGTKAPDWLKLYQTVAAIKPNHSWLWNPFARLNGHGAVHFHGALPTAEVLNFFHEIGRQSPPGCNLGTIGLSTDDLKQMRVSYDLWTAGDSDKLVLTATNRDPQITLKLTLTGKDFNRAAAITPPSQFVDLDAIRAGQTAILNRDATRRSDLDQLHDALAAYAAAHGGRFPTNLSALVPTYIAILPRDPSTSRPYAYSLAAGGKDYTLITNLEAPNAPPYSVSASNNGP